MGATDKLVIEKKEDVKLFSELEKIDWPIEYGTVTVQLRNGKPTLLKIERTIKLD